MVDIREFNNQVFNFLQELRRNDSNLRYTYRKSNYGGRLEEGYWFYGTPDYLAVSFWSGMDWKNRTPNICFIFTKSGEAVLEINVSDSDKKRSFIEENLVDRLNLNKVGRRYTRTYGVEEYAGIDFLNNFINGFNNEQSDKQIIDSIISAQSDKYFRGESNKIGFIESVDFVSQERKVLRYKEQLEDEAREIHDAQSKPSRLKSINIKCYQDLRDVQINDISNASQWIFLTGENGSGKTTVLKAISMALGYKLLDRNELTANPNFEIHATFFKGKEGEVEYNRRLNEDCNKRFPLVSGLAIFGPNRLINNKDSKKKNSTINLALKKEGLFKPLWDFEYRMLDIEEQFDIWKRDKKKKVEFEKRMSFITPLLSQVVPGLYDIRFEAIEKKRGGRSTRIDTKYIVRKDESSVEESKYWQQLPSGTRSVFAMVSEILIRLFHYQKEVLDPSELKGIVIIDEIDLHLHPNAQRKLIVDLTETFRGIQFIVATHSPIPLLGAPSDSIFVKIYRDHDKGIVLERLEDIEKNIGNMLPNILYTSPVFDVEKIYSRANTNEAEIMTQNTMSEAVDFQTLKEKLRVKSINDSEFIIKLKSKDR